MRYLITIRTLATLATLGLALLAISACSSESDQATPREEHVWEGQVEAIDKAREVETILKRKQDQQDQQ